MCFVLCFIWKYNIKSLSAILICHIINMADYIPESWYTAQYCTILFFLYGTKSTLGQKPMQVRFLLFIDFYFVDRLISDILLIIVFYNHRMFVYCCSVYLSFEVC